MKQLSKEQEAEKLIHIEALAAATNAVQAAYEALNEQIEGELNAAIQEYNNVVANAAEFAEGVAADIENYFSDHSEKWQESEVGAAYSDWASEWQCLDSGEIDKQELAICPGMELAEVLDGLPNEVQL